MNYGLHIPRYTVEQVADSVGKPVATLRNWMANGRTVINLAEYDLDAGRGNMRFLSYATAHRIAIGVRLIDFGLSSSIAFRLAESFAHLSLDADTPGRDVGGCFAEGFTVLAVARDGRGDGTLKANVINVKDAMHMGLACFNFAQRLGSDVLLTIDCRACAPSITDNANHLQQA